MLENDIFISYSHNDDKAWNGVPWVSELHRSLKDRLPINLGEEARIFFDPQLRGDEVFRKVLTEKLETTAALVSVVSPSYFNSKWCEEERDTFLRACEKSVNLLVGASGRVFKVIKLPDPELKREFNPPFDKFTGYKFYIEDPDGRAKELAPAYGQEGKFYDAVHRLADDLSKLLRQMRGLSPLPHPEVREGQGLVYLAMTSSDLKEKREELRRDLEHFGYEVWPQTPLPETVSEVKVSVCEQVARCHLSVHLIGGRYGSTPDESEFSYPELQNDIAAERKDLPRLVWFAPAQPDDQRQKNFIDRLQTAPELQGRMVPLKGSFEDLKNEVHRTLKRLAQPAPTPPVTTEYPEVYLIHDLQDREEPALRQVRNVLHENGCEVTSPLFEGDETTIRQDQEEILRRCDAVLLFWGAGSESWRRKLHNEILKSAGRGRANGAPLTLLYIVPSAIPEKDAFVSHKVSIVRHPPEGPSAKLLADFLAKLRKGPAEDAP